MPPFDTASCPPLDTTALETVPPDTPILRRGVGYYMRTGKHDVTPYDWKQVVNFIKLNK